VLVVNDGSATDQSPFRNAVIRELSRIADVRILNLRRNLGHQRAIAIGLVWIYENLKPDAVVVMDADGEDRPEDIPRLLKVFSAYEGKKTVFAQRFKRSESIGFRISYAFYRALHRLTTGISVRVGNFSVVPFEQLDTLVSVSDLWNHYAAAVFKSRLPFEMVPTSRGDRLEGKSHMNFVSLVTHGLSAISVFGEAAGVRLLIGSGIASGLLLSILALVVFVRVQTNLAIPGWATYTGGLVVIALMNIVTVAIALTLLILMSRNNMSFVPLRDYSWFVKNCERVVEQSAGR
jgi:glycosyltransferase involved in cell wall biosynthesis